MLSSSGGRLVHLACHQHEQQYMETRSLTGYAVVIVGDRQTLVTTLRRHGKDWKVGTIATTNSHTEETL